MQHILQSGARVGMSVVGPGEVEDRQNKLTAKGAQMKVISSLSYVQNLCAEGTPHGCQIPPKFGYLCIIIPYETNGLAPRQCEDGIQLCCERPLLVVVCSNACTVAART